MNIKKYILACGLALVFIIFSAQFCYAANGVCNATNGNGKAFTTLPTGTGLCSTGTVSSLTSVTGANGSTMWTWGCLHTSTTGTDTAANACFAYTPLVTAVCTPSPNPDYDNNADYVTWTASATGGSGAYAYTWTPATICAGTGSTCTDSAAFTTFGSKTETIKAVDSIGNQDTGTCTVYVDENGQCGPDNADGVTTKPSIVAANLCTFGTAPTSISGTTSPWTWTCTGQGTGGTTGIAATDASCSTFKPTISSVSPNSGTYASNLPITVTWTMNYSDTSKSIYIEVIQPSATNLNPYTASTQGVSGTGNSFTIPANSIPDGVTYVDVVDNPGFGGQNAEGDGSGSFTVTPPPPGTPDMVSADDTGISSTDNNTQNTIVRFTVPCIVGDSVVLVDLSSHSLSANTTCSASPVTVTSSTLATGGPYSIYAKQQDTAGNLSLPSATGLPITIDTTPPTAPATNPPGASVIRCHKSNFLSVQLREIDTPVRTVTKLTLSRHGNLLTIAVSADGFLYKMVRSITGALVKVGEGKLTPAELRSLIAGQRRTALVETAPARGLFLWRVRYSSRNRVHPTNQNLTLGKSER